MLSNAIQCPEYVPLIHPTFLSKFHYKPLPLSYLRLGSFTSEPETRRERTGDGGILDSLRYNNVPIYPFTVYHTASKSTRRYMLYVMSEVLRKR